MPERSSVNQVLQLGLETTPGTAVAANRQLTMMDIALGARVDMQSFRPMGFKYQTTKALNREWAEGPVSGGASYNEIVYALSSILAREVITQPPVGTAKAVWTYSPSSTGPDTVATYTIQRGSSFRAHQITHGVFTGFTLEANRNGGVSVGGTVLGRALTDGITLTAAPTLLVPIPVVSDEWAIFADDTAAGIGTTRLTRVKRVNFELTGRQIAHWFLDNSQTSFAAIVEGVPTAQIRMLVEADAVGMGYLTTMRNEATKFVRFKATGGAVPGGGGNFSLQIDAAAKVNEPRDFSDEDGLYAIEWTMDITHDVGWAKALSAVVENSLTAL